jgi:hypothetical protein
MQIKTSISIILLLAAAGLLALYLVVLNPAWKPTISYQATETIHGLRYYIDTSKVDFSLTQTEFTMRNDGGQKVTFDLTKEGVFGDKTVSQFISGWTYLENGTNDILPSRCKYLSIYVWVTDYRNDINNAVPRIECVQDLDINNLVNLLADV